MVQEYCKYLKFNQYGIITLWFSWLIGEGIADEYKFFLQEYNGGYPEPNVFNFDDQTEGSDVDYLHSLHEFLFLAMFPHRSNVQYPQRNTFVPCVQRQP